MTAQMHEPTSLAARRAEQGNDAPGTASETKARRLLDGFRSDGPGLAASDVSTQGLRAFLSDRGYAAHGWQLGRNAGPRPGVEAALQRRLAELHERHGRKVSIIGWSLGGIFAREVARRHAPEVRTRHAAGERCALLSGGELTVTVRGHGRGGPNQEYALALVQELHGLSGITVLAADTDGADGGTGAAGDPAGAFVDALTWQRMATLALNPRDYLADNNATALFEATDSVLVTGPTRTNVNDLRVILVDPA